MEGMDNQMEINKLGIDETIELYKSDIYLLLKYIPWFESQNEKHEMTYYKEKRDGVESIPVPVYSGTLLAFVNEAKRTNLIDINYRFVYSKYRINNYEDEWKLIESSDVLQMNILIAILSKYILQGMTKGVVWTEGVQHQIYYRVLLKMKEMIEFHEGESLGIG